MHITCLFNHKLVFSVVLCRRRLWFENNTQPLWSNGRSFLGEAGWKCQHCFGLLLKDSSSPTQKDLPYPRTNWPQSARVTQRLLKPSKITAKVRACLLMRHYFKRT
jgi:hypothetical protein